MCLLGLGLVVPTLTWHVSHHIQFS